jgi:hypothetical protein
MKQTTRIHAVLRLRMYGDVLALPHMALWYGAYLSLYVRILSHSGLQVLFKCRLIFDNFFLYIFKNAVCNCITAEGGIILKNW